MGPKIAPPIAPHKKKLNMHLLNLTHTQKKSQKCAIKKIYAKRQ